MSSRRIKDGLPHEVVDKIRSSSLRSKTIAIIEPVQKNKKKSDLAAAAPSRFVRHAVAAGGIGMGGITSRFQEAGISLSRNRFRQVLMISLKWSFVHVHFSINIASPEICPNECNKLTDEYSAGT